MAETPLSDVGEAGIATAAAGVTTGGLNTFCGWSILSGEAGLKGLTAGCFEAGFLVDVFGAGEAKGFFEEVDPLEGREPDDEEGEPDDEEGELWLGATTGFVTGALAFLGTEGAGFG